MTHYTCTTSQFPYDSFHMHNQSVPSRLFQTHDIRMKKILFFITIIIFPLFCFSFYLLVCLVLFFLFLQHCLSLSSPPNFLIYFSCLFSFSLLSTFTHYFLLLCLLYFVLYLRLFLILLHYIIFYILPFFLLLIHPPSPLNFLPLCVFYILPSLLFLFFILLLRLSFYLLPSVLLLLHSPSTTHFSPRSTPSH